MTNATLQPAPSPLTLERALEVQDLMVRRGVLAERAHVVSAARYVGVDVELRCSCGRHMLLAGATSEQEYALHVASALGVSLALAA